MCPLSSPHAVTITPWWCACSCFTRRNRSTVVVRVFLFHMCVVQNKDRARDFILAYGIPVWAASWLGHSHTFL